jgi:Tfp pilus assembly protein PilF
MKTSVLFFVSLAVLALSAAAANGQSVGAGRAGQNSGTYTVTGKVVLPNGTPAVNARVDVSCDFTSVWASTDSDGVYRLTGVPAGNCSIVARVDGLDPVTEHRTITRDTPQGQAVYVPIFFRSRSQAVPESMVAGVPKPAADKFKAAVEKAEKGDNDAAIRMLDEAIALHPKFAAAWYQRGAAYLRKNDQDKAIVSFVKAVEIDPEYLEAKYGFGLAQFQKKNYEVAEAVFRDVLKAKGDMAEAHLNLGISLFYLKKIAEAEAELKSAVEGEDKFALAHLYLGQLYIQQKRNSEAAGQLQRYLELAPKAPNAERIRTVLADLKKQS